MPEPAAYRIRPMDRRDLPAVLAIEEQSFATPWTSRTFVNLMRRPNAALFAAVDVRNAVVGYAVIWFAGGEGELGDLAVRHSDRGRGIGSALVDTVLVEARERGAHEIFLEVRASNTGARTLYERSGFQDVGNRPGYYNDPVEDALIMRREVSR
jgi:ribosomal-protein-alanine N-acetyltransferase